MTIVQLVPPQARGTSVARVTKAWYVACDSGSLRKEPLRRVILGMPIVLFRGEGGSPGALLDRCPHRNVPLSRGRVTEGLLECGYHGWRFDREGACKKVPSLCDGKASSGRNAPALPCVEQDGFVWVWGELDGAPVGEPFHFDLVGTPGYTTVRDHVVANGTLHATAENALDVPHTAFAHAGLFRSDDRPRNKVEVIVRREADRVEAEYVGEPRPEGVVGRILSPGGGVVSHWDRFILPSILQVEYRLEETHLLVTAALTPESDYVTHLFAVVCFKLPIPGWTVVPFLKPLAMRIFRQDAELLQAQTETVERFGGEQFVSTEVDILGPHILRLLRAAERGKVDSRADSAGETSEVKESRFEMEV